MVLKTVLILILLAPLSSWGQSVLSQEQISSLLNQVQQKNLSSSPGWLRLGHYRKRTFGGYYSPFRGTLFVAEDGSTNPTSELNATIQLLFSKPEQQCRYLARTSWLKKQIEIPPEALHPCPERVAWKEQLGAKELYLIFASGDLNSAGSSFGHTFLRAHNLKNVRNLDLLDYGINYSAATGEDGGALYALKGLFGLYPAAYSMLPYHQKIREYTNIEGRDLWEYKIMLSPEEVDMIIDHLLELEGSWAPYYFLKENCSRQILELIEVARPELQLSSQFHESTIPLDTVKVMNQNHLLSGEKLRISLQTEWRASYKKLDREEKSILQDLTLQQKDLSQLKSLTPQEQANTLDATLRYISIEDYRNNRDSKDAKYTLSVARAQLRLQAEPLQFVMPESPLDGHDSSAWYLGYGKYDEHDFYRLKYRRAFHDLLSNDSGIVPFSHLEVLSAEFRYFPEEDSLNLSHFVVLKMLSTSPINELDTPISWQVDVGTEPKLAPYFNFGVGVSGDFNVFAETRATLMMVSENYHLFETAQPYLGPELLLMTKSSQWRFLMDGRYLWKTTTGEMIWDYGAGFSFDIKKAEARLEFRNREEIPEIQFTLLF